MQAQPLIAVRDVEASSLWYRTVLGGDRGRVEKGYEQILHGGGPIMHIREWDAREYPLMGDPGNRLRGNGMMLWFHTTDLDAALIRARSVSAVVLDGPRQSAKSGERELWLRDNDGYVVVIAGK